MLHHIVNIEHLLAQVARALTPNGVFFVMEYMGEERFKWTPEKTRFLNGLLADLPLSTSVTRWRRSMSCISAA